LLRKLALDGLNQRYGRATSARQQMEKELTIIDQMDFSAYFLSPGTCTLFAKPGFFLLAGEWRNSIVPLPSDN
jgi:DNA polymerase III alpha subunit